MIVNYTESGWKIISQRSHGLLAGQICAFWKPIAQFERWVELLIATAEHDDVYNEFENDDLLNENGGPVHFKGTTFKYDYAQRLVQMAETKSAYIALLVSRHIQFVHGADPAADAFIRDLKVKEKKWIKTAGMSAAQVSSSYELLGFCDAFSLLICQDLIQPEHRKIEISNGPDGIAYEMHALNADKITVKPWPFKAKTFEVYYESKTIAQLSFKTIAEFRKVFHSAETITHKLTLSAVEMS